MGGWAYMVRCSNDSFYVGSSSYMEIDIRVAEHNDGKFDGYTSKRRPVKLVWAEWFNDLRDAHMVERRIKGWRREKKGALIRHDWRALKQLAKRPGARRPSRLAFAALGLAPQGDALRNNRHPEVAAKRPSKDDGGKT